MNKKFPHVFYGWWIVTAAFIISLFVSGTISHGFSAFIEPLNEEFGWSYTQISLASSLRGFEVGLLAPIVGVLIDRWGPRRLMLGGAILAGLGLVLLSRTTSLVMFYAVFVLIAVGVSNLSPTVTMTAVANWFRRKVGMATGIMHSGVGFGGLIVPVVIILVDTFGWRTAVVILGLCFFGIVLPLSLLVRHKPEQYGLLPDGEVSNIVVANEGSPLVPTTDEDVAAREAVRSSAFWHISLAVMCQATIMSAVFTHVVPYSSSLGLPRSTSGLVASAVPLVGVCGRLSFGWLGDRVDKRRIMAGGYVMMSLGLLLFAWAANGNLWLLVPFAVLVGVGSGGNAVIRAAIVREYFGRRNFGTIHGFVMGIFMVGSIAGPLLAGWVFDSWGSYQGIWFAYAALALVAVALVTTMSIPQRPIK